MMQGSSCYLTDLGPWTPFRQPRMPYPRQKSGYHIGQICRTSARQVRCSSTVAVVLPVRKTVTATELDSDVAVCASAKEDAQIMTKKAELIMTMMCAEYYGADIKLIKLIIFTYYIAGPLVQIYFQQ